ncbi:AMP-binding protein [Streptomyces sp. E2N166]|uniref:AMP-binding protein n=1 Tax=Streptomyces sp. E2N166 TaxID=1851909 RepID=UPI000EF6FB5A|nr:AMP-binding protein [Streptomyces sp. E2N166]
MRRAVCAFRFPGWIRLRRRLRRSASWSTSHPAARLTRSTARALPPARRPGTRRPERQAAAEAAQDGVPMQDRDPIAPSTHATPRERPARAAERALWLLDRVAPDRAVSNITLAVRSAAPLDVAYVRRALGTIIRRHPALRSRFVLVDDVLTRRVEAASDDPSIDVLTVAQEDADETLRRFAERPFAFPADQPAAAKPRETDGEPLIRAVLVVTPTADTLCVVCHHTIFDGTSALLLTGELVRAYAALSADGQVPPDLLAEAADFTPPPPGIAGLSYWHDQLAGVNIRSMDLRCDRPRPAEPTFRGEQHVHPLSQSAHDLLGDSEAALQATRNIIFLAAYLLVLARHGAGPDVTVGVPVDVRGGRGRGTIGYHTHTVVLRLDMERPGTFRELVALTRDTFLAALGHADASIDDVIDRYGTFGGSAENRYFHHMFNYFDFHTSVEKASWTPDGADVDVVEVAPRHSVADLEIVVRTRRDRTELVVLHCTDVIDRADALALAGRYDTLLHSALRAPDTPLRDLTWHTGLDRRALTPPTARATPWRGGVLAAITAHARRTPDAIAVVDADTGRTTNYAALVDQAARIRDGLGDAGVGPGKIVALDSARTAATLAGALAVWSLGAAYLPVDHAQPAPLTARRLAGTRVAAVLGRPLDSATLPDVPTIPLPAPCATGPWRDLPDTGTLTPDTLAFVIHTSGSTGLPKGVRLTQGNVHHAVTTLAAGLGLDADASALWSTTFTFEPSSLEVFTPLVLGGRVVAAPDAVRHDPARLAALLTRHHVGLVQATPTVWSVLAPGLEGRCEGVDLVTGGEPLSAATARALLSTGGRVLNAYGATETAGWPVMGEITPACVGNQPLRVGRPTGGHRVDIVDDTGRPLPPGLRGDIRITGPAVAAGYMNAPLRHTTDDAGHRTGDIGRLCADGTLEVVGRADRQIKLLGLRVEPAEVEGVLEDHPSVSRCGVIAARDAESPSLVAFVETTATVDPATLRAHAARHLPAPAVPSRIVAVSALPRTDTGKVAHTALHGLLDTFPPDTAPTDPHRPELLDDHATGDALTERLTSAWRAVLADDTADSSTDFFAAGGNSLLAVLLSERVEDLTGHRVSLGTLLNRVTPAALAAHLAEAPSPAAPASTAKPGAS